MGVVVPWDFFHLGLLLVVIMVFITGIVICVAVAGVCCFHWIDSKQNGSRESDNNKSPCANRDERVGVENSLNERMRRIGCGRKEEGPPPYEDLFPKETPVVQSYDPRLPITMLPTTSTPIQEHNIHYV